MIYKNRQQAVNVSTINITKWGTKKKMVDNTSKTPDIIGWEARKFAVAVAILVILSVEFINPLVQIISRYEDFV